MIRPIVIGFVALSLLACTRAASVAPHPTITAYSDAYNAQDLAAMRALMHDDIEWLSVNGSDIVVEVAGKDALSEAMTSFFEDPNMATGTHKGWSVNQDYVAVTETAHWTNKAGEAQSQSALTVYELKDGLIRRVYYYPPQNTQG